MNERPDSPPGSRPPVTPPTGHAPPPPPGYPPMAYAPPKQRGPFARAFAGIVVSIFIFSLLMNVYLLVLVANMSKGLNEIEYQAGDAMQRIVILPVNGLIDSETSSFVRQALDALRDNPPVALILRVDSGGGLVSPSDRIWHDLVEFKKDTGIPVVASFGGVAASGGYYIAAPANKIIAEPTCITGSIGVMAQAFTVDQLLAKIGVTPEVLVATESPQKDVANNIMRAWDDNDRAKLRVILDHAHTQFVDVVTQGRTAVTQLSPDQISELADGRVFTAEAALNEQLIDQVGYLDDAVEEAGKLASLAPGVTPQVTVISQPKSIFSALASVQADQPAMSLDADGLRSTVHELAVPQVLYLWSGR